MFFDLRKSTSGKCFLTFGSWLPGIFFYFQKLTSRNIFWFTYGCQLPENVFWLSEVNFREYFLIFGSRLLVIIFDFWKSTSGDTFWLPEVDFWWYILTSKIWLPVIYFDLRKSYILTSESRHNSGSVVSAGFLKWSKGFLGI